MKKITLLAVCALFSNSLFSQQWDGATNSTDPISRNGSVSIGTLYQLDRLNLGGNLRLIDGGINFGYMPPHPMIVDAPNSYFKIDFYPSETGTFFGNSYNNPAALYFHPSIGGMSFPGQRELSLKTLVLGYNHKVGMGTDTFTCSDCSGYRLFVKDGIKTEKVKVEIAASNGWADYVFNDDYKLMPLNDLDKFIKTNGHLPEVPTTEQAIANGIELKEMNILLLKKVEELTLYALQQNKKIENLEEANEKLQGLSERVKALETQMK